MKAFAPAEYLLDISDFTSDGPSVIPLPRNLIRAIHTTYPVAVNVPASKGNVINRAPWGLGANFIEFRAAGSGDLVLGFDGTDGFAWRAFAVATGKGPAQIIEIALDAGSSGSVTVSGFGTRWSKVALVPTIADRPGAEVPFAYTAGIN